MKTHLTRLKQCNRILGSFKYNEDELYNMSLVKHIDNDKKAELENKAIKKNEDNKTIKTNEDKKFKCEKCDMLFTTNGNLKRHAIRSCKNNDEKNILNNNTKIGRAHV